MTDQTLDIGLLLGLAAVVVVLIYVAVRRVRSHRGAKRALELHRGGEPFDFPVRVRHVINDFRRRYVSARLRVHRDKLWLRVGRNSVDLATLLHGQGRFRLAGDSELRDLRTPSIIYVVPARAGGHFEFMIPAPYLELGEEALDRAAQSDATQPSSSLSFRSRWPVPTSVVFVLLVGAFVSQFVYGELVVATVTGHRGDLLCEVEWVDPLTGAIESGVVDCGNEAVGTTLDVLAHTWPFRGEASEVVAFAAAGIMILVLLGAFVGLGIAVRHRRWRLIPVQADVKGVEPMAFRDGAQPLDIDEELAWDRLEELISHRAATERWATRTTDSWPNRDQPGWLTSDPFKAELTKRRYALVAGLFLVVASLLTGPDMPTTLTLSLAPTSIAVGEVTRLVCDECDPPHVEVVFSVREESIRTTVQTGEVRSPGASLEVRFLRSDPTIARGADLGLAQYLPLVLVFVGTSLVAFQMLRIARTVRALRSTYNSPEREIRYLLAPGPAEDAIVLMSDVHAVGPRYGTDVDRQVLSSFPLFGSALARGLLGADSYVVLRIGDHTVWPLGTLSGLEGEIATSVIDTLNGGRPISG